MKNNNLNKIDKSGYSIFHKAIISASPQQVKALIQRGASLTIRTIKGLTPLELSLYSGRASIFRALLPFYSKREYSLLLHTASALNKPKVVAELIRLGISPNVKDASGRTALHWAAQENSISTAKILLDSGANVDILDFEKFTPLAIVSGEGHLRFASLLITNGANVNKKIGDGTALHLACAWSHRNIVKYLVRIGAKVDFKNSDGLTPLDISMTNDKKEITKILLKSRNR